jgi:hypothetical protein
MLAPTTLPVALISTLLTEVVAVTLLALILAPVDVVTVQAVSAVL